MIPVSFTPNVILMKPGASDRLFDYVSRTPPTPPNHSMKLLVIFAINSCTCFCVTLLIQ